MALVASFLIVLCLPATLTASSSGAEDARKSARVEKHKLVALDAPHRHDGASTIPHILHHIFLDGEAEYDKAVAAGERPGAKKAFKRQWRTSCTERHREGWTYMFWDREKAIDFFRKYHSWFLDAWLAYPMVVLQGDALRAFLMYHYGGLYLDLDVECFHAADTSLGGASLVLQAEFAEGDDVVNSVMASVPGHPYFQRVIRLMSQRSQVPKRNDIGFKDVLDSTGPFLYAEVFRQWSGLSHLVGDHQVHGWRVVVKGLGEWYIPCQWFDWTCHEQTEASLVGKNLSSSLIGYHRYTATWRGLVKEPWTS